MEDAASLLKTLSEVNILSVLRQFPWNFIHSTIDSPADFDSADLCRLILHTLPSDFDNAFNEVTEDTELEEIISIVRIFYCHQEGDNRRTDQFTGDYVTNWTPRTNDDSGLIYVSQVLHPIFIQESKFAAVRHLASCLDSIWVCPWPDQGTNLGDRNGHKNQVVSSLSFFSKIWCAHYLHIEFHGPSFSVDSRRASRAISWALEWDDTEWDGAIRGSLACIFPPP